MMACRKQRTKKWKNEMELYCFITEFVPSISCNTLKAIANAFFLYSQYKKSQYKKYVIVVNKLR